MNQPRILCLSGSLREASYNTAAIRALARLVPGGVDLVVYEGMESLPLFNPDREEEGIPAVADLKREVGRADGLLIASPEYAHGISGVLKNALDWLVSGEEFPYKPVALVNTSPRASHAQAALREVIKTMSGTIVEPACISIPLLGSNLDADGIISHPEISQALTQAIDEFCKAIAELEPCSGN